MESTVIVGPKAQLTQIDTLEGKDPDHLAREFFLRSLTGEDSLLETMEGSAQ